MARFGEIYSIAKHILNLIKSGVQVGEEGPLALKGNIHMSMFDIHAACENEDDNEGEELEHLRLVTGLSSFVYSCCSYRKRNEL